MSQENDYLLRMRQQNYNTGTYSNNYQNNYQRNNTMTNEQQPQPYKQSSSDDPNSCYNLVCDGWNLALLMGTVLSIAFIVGLIIAYK